MDFCTNAAQCTIAFAPLARVAVTITVDLGAVLLTVAASAIMAGAGA